MVPLQRIIIASIALIWLSAGRKRLLKIMHGPMTRTRETTTWARRANASVPLWKIIVICGEGKVLRGEEVEGKGEERKGARLGM